MIYDDHLCKRREEKKSIDQAICNALAVLGRFSCSIKNGQKNLSEQQADQCIAMENQGGMNDQNEAK